MNVSAIYKETVHQLSQLYDEGEARSLADILFADLLEIGRTERLTNPTKKIPALSQKKWTSAIDRLLHQEPIQHIVGFTYFLGYKFLVNKNALIPRMETEELVNLIVAENQHQEPKILDIGTGTGCIAITLALKLQSAHVETWDISEESIRLAKSNADSLEARVTFRTIDVLSYSAGDKFDVIVSNPPYIPAKEKSELSRNVLEYEPEKALFVPDEDPLLFYRVIGKLGRSNLKDHGKLYFEIHEDFGNDVKQLLENLGYQSVSVFKDMQGKDRMVRALLRS